MADKQGIPKIVKWCLAHCLGHPLKGKTLRLRLVYHPIDETKGIPFEQYETLGWTLTWGKPWERIGRYVSFAPTKANDKELEGAVQYINKCYERHGL